MKNLFDFHQVFEDEIKAVNSRRDELGRAFVKLVGRTKDRYGNPLKRPSADSNLVGLALSGGGIRSASFCLGALQALDAQNYLRKIDYLSTVSGGGYIGTSMTAAMSLSGDHRFPFPSELQPEESPGLQHIRDYSNYLFPRGRGNIPDILSNLVIYFRGVLFSFLLVLPWLLLLACLTIFSNQSTKGLAVTNLFGITSIFGHKLPYFSGFVHFGLTVDMLLVFAASLAVWGFFRSFNIFRKFGEIGRPDTKFVSFIFVLLAVTAFCEAQRFALSIMTEVIDGAAVGLPLWFKSFVSAFAVFSAAMGFLAPYLARVLKQGWEDTRWRARIIRVATQVAIYVAAASVPLVLWIGYLYLSFWGLCSGECGSDPHYGHAPGWLIAAIGSVRNWGTTLLPGYAGSGTYPGNPIQFYFLLAIVMLLLQLIFNPNANSLHRLYRDRLSKAFLFDPKPPQDGSGWDMNLTSVRSENLADQQRRSNDLLELTPFKINEIRCKYAPYQIINTALNIRGSKYANRRGRNADFFIFSPKFTGSKATRYIRTKDLEDGVGELDLGAAMAVSGAAASSNMGSATIKPLSPTLTLLNIRLGFWLPNPTAFATGRRRAKIAQRLDFFYFWKEIFGLLREDDGLVYLTDGGHVENLGIYELLRRHCQLIIAVDAEADGEMNFNSLVALERHALIDLGVRINLPWAAIRDATQTASAEIAESGGKPPREAEKGPHCALGEIEYPGGQKGVLLYLKSSLSGDESDEIVDYKRRFPDFPHETTADQLFSEEQFEVYRALGFHGLNRAFLGEDVVALDPKAAPLERATRHRLVRKLLDILG